MSLQKLSCSGAEGGVLRNLVGRTGASHEHYGACQPSPLCNPPKASSFFCSLPQILCARNPDLIILFLQLVTGGVRMQERSNIPMWRCRMLTKGTRIVSSAAHILWSCFTACLYLQLLLEVACCLLSSHSDQDREVESALSFGN